jgi:hypothetical protein
VFYPAALPLTVSEAESIPRAKADGVKNPVGLDTERANQEFAFVKKTDFRKGLRRTIDWYLSACNRVAERYDSGRRLEVRKGLRFNE